MKTLSILATLAFPMIAVAQNDTNQLTIINHFNKPLTYIVGRNADVLPDVAENFTLQTGEEVTTRVLDLKKEAYIRAEDDEQHSAFWGVDLENDQTHVHGYMAKGIAYSWDLQRVIFCTPEEYKTKNSCMDA